MANNSDPIVKVFSLGNSWYKYHLLSVGVFFLFVCLFVFVCLCVQRVVVLLGVT